MSWLFRASDALARGLFAVSGLLLVFMMMVVVVDVGLRAVFTVSAGTVDVGFNGAIELVRIGLLFTVVCALPAAVERGQVVVETFTNRLPERGKDIMFAAYLVGFCGFGLILAFGWFASGQAALSHRETTQDLGIPMAPIYFAAALCAVLLAGRSLVCAIRSVAKGRRQ